MSGLKAHFAVSVVAAYAYTLTVVLLGLWQVPAAADAALMYFLGRLR